MSAAGIARISAKHANDALMKEMGSPNGHDPIPPHQHMYFLRPRDLGRNAHRALAWLRWKTIRRKPDGSRSAWAKDNRGDLTLTHMAEDLGWSLSNASRDWAKLEDHGLGRRDEHGRLCLCGNIPAAKPPQQTEDAVICTNNRDSPLPRYLNKQIQQLSEENRRKFEAGKLKLEEFTRRIEAEAMAAARAFHQKLEQEFYGRFGLTLKRQEKGEGKEKKGRKAKASAPVDRPAPPVVQLSLLTVPDFFAQDAAVSVQDADEKAYSQKGMSVQEAVSLFTLPKESKEGAPERSINAAPFPAEHFSEEKSSSSTSALSPLTTTTIHPAEKIEIPPEAAPGDQATVAEAIRPYTVPAPYVVRKLIQLCRQADPRVTAEEIAGMIHRKAPQARRGGNCAAYLWKAVPEPFADGGLDEIRAAPPSENSPARSLLEEYNDLKAVCRALPEKHEQRPAMNKRLDELRERLYAEYERNGKVQ